MNNAVNKARAYLEAGIWEVDLSHYGKMQAFAVLVTRFVLRIIMDILNGQLSLRAMGLVYTTLLSLVPLLAVSFSVLKAFDVHNQILPVLNNFLAPLGDSGQQISHNIVKFVENVKVGVLGSIGFALLFFTVISLIQKVENALNYIWWQPDSRSFFSRFSQYISIILLGPVFVFTAFGLTASMVSNRFVQSIISMEPFGTAYYIAGLSIPYVLLTVAFTFIYVFLPNTKVSLLSAFVGALIAAILWRAAGWGFAVFVVNSTQYDAIYSSFAILIIFMIWLYVSWLILLLGAQIAFYHQHPEFLRPRRMLPMLSNRLREQLGLGVMYLVAQRYVQGGTPWTVETLASRLCIAEHLITEVVTVLKEGHLLLSAEEKGTLIPARDLTTIYIDEVLTVLRGRPGFARSGDNFHITGLPCVNELFVHIDQAVKEALAKRTLREWVESGDSDDARLPHGSAPS